MFELWEHSTRPLAQGWQTLLESSSVARHCSRGISRLGRLAQPQGLTEELLHGGPVAVGRSPFRVVWRHGPARLRCYQPDQRQHATPLLIVYALVNRPYILDLLPGRSVIERLTGLGFCVYLLDWGHPGRNEAELPLEVFIDDVLGGAVDAVREREACERVDLLGYCQGGTLATEYAAARPQTLRSLSLLAAPVDFDKMQLLRLWSRHFDPRALRSWTGNVSGVGLSAAFEALNPWQRGQRWGGMLSTWLRGKSAPNQREHFCAMERWMAEPVDHPGQAYVDFVERYYQQNALLPKLGTLELPLLCIVGEKDKLVPPAASLAVLEAANSSRSASLRSACGHVGLCVGRRAQEKLWPAVAGWLGDL